MIKPGRLLLLMYLIFSLGELYSRYTAHDILHFISKPLLIILLLAYFHVSLAGRSNKITKLMSWGLACSWLGDVLLMFEARDPLFFMGGLFAFLATHLLYILAFSASVRDFSKSVFKTRPAAVVPFVLIGVFFYYTLFPGLNGLKIPVLIYTGMLVTMVVFSLNRVGSVGVKSFRLVYYGAIMFMISDLLLAIDKFMTPVEHAGVYIMATYSLAQFLIVRGVLEEDVIGS